MYAIVTSGSAISAANFSSSNTATVYTAGNYDVYVRDKNGAANYCELFETVTVIKTPDLDVSANVTQPKCFNETGNLDLTFSGGKLPYTVAVTNTLGFSDTNS